MVGLENGLFSEVTGISRRKRGGNLVQFRMQYLVVGVTQMAVARA